MTRDELADRYRGYIDCLNRQDWVRLGAFVNDDAVHNGRRIGLNGYREMLEADYRTIPDLRFNIDLIVVDPPVVASRLLFDCTPIGRFLDLSVDGRRIRFAEHVMYAFRDGRIAEVWSVIDKTAVEAQLREPWAGST